MQCYTCRADFDPRQDREHVTDCPTKPRTQWRAAVKAAPAVKPSEQLSIFEGRG